MRTRIGRALSPFFGFLWGIFTGLAVEIFSNDVLHSLREGDSPPCGSLGASLLFLVSAIGFFVLSWQCGEAQRNIDELAEEAKDQGKIDGLDVKDVKDEVAEEEKTGAKVEYEARKLNLIFWGVVAVASIGLGVWAYFGWPGLSFVQHLLQSVLWTPAWAIASSHRCRIIWMRPEGAGAPADKSHPPPRSLPPPPPEQRHQPPRPTLELAHQPAGRIPLPPIRVVGHIFCTRPRPDDRDYRRNAHALFILGVAECTE